MTASTVGVKAWIEGAKIVIESVFDDARADFLGSLPKSRWNRKRLCWECQLTPAAAWRIVSREDASCSDELEEKANAFRERIAYRDVVTTDANPVQPKTRKGDDWRHQSQAYHFASSSEATMLACAMGSGKSRVVVNLLQNRQSKLCLIVCPKSVTRVWPEQFNRHAALPFHVAVLDQASVTGKKRIADDLVDEAELRCENLVLIVNYESVWREPLGNWVLAQNWDAIVADESHRIRSHNSSVSKFFAKLYERSAFRLCLTGTPMATPFDVFGQYRFLDPGLFGTSWHRFQHRYARMNALFPSKVEEWRNQDELAERFATLAFQIDASVLDLPEVLHERRIVELSPEAQKVYDDLQSELCAEVGAETVTVANALVKAIKLREVTSGFVIHDDRERTSIVDHAKAESLREILEDVGDEPVVVFCVFTAELDAVRSVCESVGKKYGELSGSDKSGLSDRGTMAEDVDIVGVQIQSGGVGIDLTRARYAVYFSVDFDPIIYKQSLARVHRPGQERPVVYYHLLAKDTIDWAVYGALERKESIVEAVMNYLRGKSE